MNRRGFLSSLIAGAAALSLDPDCALWVPGKKLISIPKPQPVSDDAIFKFIEGRINEAYLAMQRELDIQLFGISQGVSEEALKPVKYYEVNQFRQYSTNVSVPNGGKVIHSSGWDLA